jgi:hypothetical protein
MLYVTFFKEGAGIAERLLCGMVFLVLVAGVVLAVLGRGKKVAGVAARAGEPFRFEFKTLKGLHSLWLDYVWSGPGEELAGDDSDQVPSAAFELRVSVTGPGSSAAGYRDASPRVLVEALVTPGSSALGPGVSGDPIRTVEGTKPICELPPLPAGAMVTVEGLFPSEAWSRYEKLEIRATVGSLFGASTPPKMVTSDETRAEPPV